MVNGLENAGVPAVDGPEDVLAVGPVEADDPVGTPGEAPKEDSGVVWPGSTFAAESAGALPAGKALFTGPLVVVSVLGCTYCCCACWSCGVAGELGAGLAAAVTWNGALTGVPATGSPRSSFCVATI